MAGRRSKLGLLLLFVATILLLGTAHILFTYLRPQEPKAIAGLFDEYVRYYHGPRPKPGVGQELADGICDIIPAAKPVVDAVRPKDRDRKDILDDIAAIGPEAVELLREKLASSDPAIHRCAAFALRRVVEKRTVTCMTGLLDDDDLFVRIVAIEALARVGGPDSIEVLAEKLSDPCYDSTFDFHDGSPPGGASLGPIKVKARSWIAYCLARSGRTEAIPALREAAGTADRQVSATANWALNELGAAPRAGPVIDPQWHRSDH